MKALQKSTLADIKGNVPEVRSTPDMSGVIYWVPINTRVSFLFWMVPGRLCLVLNELPMGAMH